jgi:hypothetical protein
VCVFFCVCDWCVCVCGFSVWCVSECVRMVFVCGVCGVCEWSMGVCVCVCCVCVIFVVCL